MVALGLFLLLASSLLTAVVAIQNAHASTLSVLGAAVHGTVGGLFVAGFVTGAIALLGLLLMVAGARRRRSRRLGLKRAVRDARGEKESLAEENARLERELAASRASGEPVAGSEPVASPRHGLFRS